MSRNTLGQRGGRDKDGEEKCELVCACAGMCVSSSESLLLSVLESDPDQPLASSNLATVRRNLRLRGGDGGVEVDPQDVAYLLADLWACRSARQDAEAGRHDPVRPYKATFRATQQLVLTRWDGAQPARVDNLVLLTFDEADAHDAEPGGVAGVRAREPPFAASVDATLARARREHGMSDGRV